MVLKCSLKNVNVVLCDSYLKKRKERKPLRKNSLKNGNSKRLKRKLQFRKIWTGGVGEFDVNKHVIRSGK